jgi:hypothetical protein
MDDRRASPRKSMAGRPIRSGPPPGRRHCFVDTAHTAASAQLWRDSRPQTLYRSTDARSASGGSVICRGTAAIGDFQLFQWFWAHSRMPGVRLAGFPDGRHRRDRRLWCPALIRAGQDISASARGDVKAELLRSHGSTAVDAHPHGDLQVCRRSAGRSTKHLLAQTSPRCRSSQWR